VHKHKNRSKPFLHTNFKLRHVWNAEKNASHDTQEISLTVRPHDPPKCLFLLDLSVLIGKKSFSGSPDPHPKRHNWCTYTELLLVITWRYASLVYAVVECLSVTRWCRIKTPKRGIMQTTPHDSRGISGASVACDRNGKSERQCVTLIATLIAQRWAWYNLQRCRRSGRKISVNVFKLHSHRYSALRCVAVWRRAPPRGGTAMHPVWMHLRAGPRGVVRCRAAPHVAASSVKETIAKYVPVCWRKTLTSVDMS